MTAHNKIIAARTALILDQPFFGSLALRLKVQADPSCPTAWVDGRTLGYNPTFVESLGHEELVALVAHEVEHVALGHPWRRGARDHRKFNVACDKAINTHLQEAGFTLPPDAYYAEGDEIGKSAEWIYGHMADEQPQPDEPGADEQPDGDGEEDGDGDGGDGEDSGKPDPQGEVRDAPAGPDADGDPAPTEQEWKEATATATALAKSQGKMPGGLARGIADALKPRVDVRSLLLRFMQERSASDYTWTRPNLRYMAQGVYLPSLQSHQMGEVAVFIDTSGSIDDVALASAKAIVQSVLDECNPSGVSIYFADTGVAHVERLERGDLLTWKPEGGGGTDFCAVMQAIDDDENRPVCAICISDLDGTFPAVAPETPTIWLATQERNWMGETVIAPFGETVYVTE